MNSLKYTHIEMLLHHSCIDTLLSTSKSLSGTFSRCNSLKRLSAEREEGSTGSFVVPVLNELCVGTIERGCTDTSAYKNNFTFLGTPQNTI